jgi:hypothetical protein
MLAFRKMLGFRFVQMQQDSTDARLVTYILERSYRWLYANGTRCVCALGVATLQRD